MTSSITKEIRNIDFPRKKKNFRKLADLWLSPNNDSSIDIRDSSRATYARAIKQFLLFLVAKDIDVPTQKDIKDFRANLSDRLKPSTVQNYLAAIKLFFKWLSIRREYPNITDGVKSPKVGSSFKKSALTIKESKDLLNCAKFNTIAEKRDKAMIALMLVCGLRTIEISRAKVSSLVKRDGKTILFVHGKGRDDDKDEFVRVPAHVESLIRDYLNARGNIANSQFLFTSASRRNAGGQLSTRSISRVAKNSLCSIGLTDESYTAHSLRHSAATNAIRLGASIDETSKMLRHKSIVTTDRYNHALNSMENRAESLIDDALFESSPVSNSDEIEVEVENDTPSETHKKKKSTSNEIEVSCSGTISVHHLISALKSEGFRLI
ncbi:MAG: tyrosine-type recombinase/integrase [Alphaproteobacteria bacterium]|nr:tyrosine-type recombinase/integrase [Alphaproteobacteria bacterium]